MPLAAPAPVASETSERDRGRRVLAWAAAAALFGFWVLYVSTLKGVDGDYYWHLLAGRLMLAGHPPFTVDEFSWTAAGRPWFDHEWLGEVALARVWALGGMAAAKSAYAALMVGWYLLVLAVFVRAGSPLAPASWGALATCLTAQTALWPRMQGFSLLGLTATVLLLQAWWGDDARQRPRRLAPWAIAAYAGGVALWANLHGGGAIAGPASCAIVLAAEAGRAAVRRTPARDLRDLAIATALSWLALLANPRGWRLLAFSASPLLDPAISAMNAQIPEWRPFALSDPMCRHVALWALAIVAMLALTRTRPRASMAALAIAWALLGAHSRRQLALAAIVLAPIAGMALEAASRAVGRSARSWRAGAALAIGVVLTIGPAIADRLVNGPLDTGLRFPSKAAIRAAVSLAPGRRMLNLYDWGGELLEAGYPELKDFVDGRQYPFGRALNAAHDRMIGAEPGWRRALARYGIDMVVAPPDVPLAGKLEHRADWAIAFADRTAVVLVKRGK